MIEESSPPLPTATTTEASSPTRINNNNNNDSLLHHRRVPPPPTPSNEPTGGLGLLGSRGGGAMSPPHETFDQAPNNNTSHRPKFMITDILAQHKPTHHPPSSAVSSLIKDLKDREAAARLLQVQSDLARAGGLPPSCHDDDPEDVDDDDDDHLQTDGDSSLHNGGKSVKKFMNKINK